MSAGSADVIDDKPLAARVEALAGFGLPAAEIALVLHVGETDLTSAYRDELASGQIKANARVAESLYRKALGDGREAVTAAIFWLKTRARWKETSVHKHTGEDAGPIRQTIEHQVALDAELFTRSIAALAANHAARLYEQ